MSARSRTAAGPQPRDPAGRYRSRAEWSKAKREKIGTVAVVGGGAAATIGLLGREDALVTVAGAALAIWGLTLLYD